MARSDELRSRLRAILLAGLLVGVGAIVSGCSTTQDEAARLQLNSARIRASERHTVVRSAGRRVQVQHVSLVSSSHGSAFVVEIRNPGDRAVGDLPISVGIREPHKGRVDLNVHATQELSYFDSHLPTVAAAGSLTWVYPTGRHVARGAHPFALVGDRPTPAVTAAGNGRAPVIDARVVSRAAAGPGRTRLKISLHNTTSVPQYQLQVYAVGRRAGREVAAGAATVPHLGGHRTEIASLPVIGSLAHVRVELAALPTIFQ